MILVDGQMKVPNLFVDRFCLKPFAVWGADSREQFTQSKTDQLINRPTKVVHGCPADLTNDYLVKPRIIKNG